MANWTLAHMSEVLVLPCAAICAVTAWALMLWLAFVPEVTVGVGVGLVLLVAITVICTVLVNSLRLPYSLHLADLIVLAVLLLSGIGQGQMSRAILLTFTWIASLLLGSTVSGTPPFHVYLSARKRENVADRREELRTEWEIYALQRSEWRRDASRLRGGLLVGTALIGWVVAGGIGLQTVAQRQLPLATAAAVLCASVMVIVALLGLLNRRRHWERDPSLQVDAAFSRPWAVVVLSCAVSTSVVALVLPANLSPLYVVDWNSIMSELTVRLFGRVRPDRVQVDAMHGSWADPGTGVGSYFPGGGLELVPMLYSLLTIAIIAYGAWKLMGLFVEADAARRRGLLAILRIVFRLPLTLLQLLGDRLFSLLARSGVARDGAGRVRPTRHKAGHERAKSPSARANTVRRMFVLLLIWAKEQGVPRSSAETAAEFSRTLAERFPAVADDISYLADAYQDVRYSLDRDEALGIERLRACYKRIVGAGEEKADKRHSRRRRELSGS